MKRALVIGDSHVATLKRGLDQLPPAQVADDVLDIVGISGAQLIEPFFMIEDGVARITLPGLAGRIPRLPLETGVDAYFWSGLFHFAKIWRDPTWMRFRPWQVAGRERPVSDHVIAAKLFAWFPQQLAAVEVLRRSGVPIYALESPRPFRHHPCLRAIRPEIVAGVDRVCQRIMHDHLVRLDVPVLRIPQDSQDADGFMLARWRHDKPDDSHHGGVAFGIAMVQRILDTLRGRDDG